jgi:sugar (pentulose or hexulose) kinase
VKDLVLGLDCSTTAAKAIVWDAHGRAQAEGRAPIALQCPRPGWYEQDADEWWTASVTALSAAARAIDPARLAGLCVTHQRETFVPLDAEGHALGPAIVWMDERATAEVEELASRQGRARIHAVTGKPLCVTPSLTKILWLAHHRPDVFARARFADVHAWLALRLTGRFCTGLAAADPMGLIDLGLGDWDEPLLSAVGLSRTRLPALVPTGALLGRLTDEASHATGLPSGLPVYAGGGDGQIASLGAGLLGPGRAYLNLGTAVVAGVVSPRFATGDSFRTLAGAAPGTFVLESDLKGGTFTIEWFVSRFGGGAGIAEMDRRAAEVGPGAGGLLLVPYWAGVMNPYWDDRASGIVVGWTGAHGPAHFFRAILEGIAFEQRSALDGIEAATAVPLQEIVALGGGARSDLWCQILADVTGRRLVRSASVEATSLGAAILAAVGAGLHPDLAAAVSAMTAHRDAFTPGPDAPRYAPLREVHGTLYPALASALRRLAELRS